MLMLLAANSATLLAGLSTNPTGRHFMAYIAAFAASAVKELRNAAWEFETFWSADHERAYRSSI
jgi:hypothetical protein